MIAILLNVILLVLGMIMDMAPIILITTTILLPIATSISIDPIQYGVMLVLNYGIGLMLITFIPAITLCIPWLTGYGA